jgi:hypothetical protein
VLPARPARACSASRRISAVNRSRRSCGATRSVLLEHRGRVGAAQAPQPRMSHRLVRGVTLPGMAIHRQPHQVLQAQQPGSRDDVGRVAPS